MTRSYWRPDMRAPAPLYIINPIKIESNLGKTTAVYPDIQEALTDKNKVYGTLKTYQGTKREEMGAVFYDDTAQVNCWFRPDISTDTRVFNPITKRLYKVITEPENVNNKNQYLVFKVKGIHNGRGTE